MKTAVVTGAGGFVGSHLVDVLTKHGVFVYAIIRKENFRTELWTSNKNLEIICCELAELHNLATKIPKRVDVFYHLAWDGSAGPMRGDESIQLSNVQYTVDALRLCLQLECKRFVGAGSLMEQEVLEVTRMQGENPSLYNIYSAAKLAAHSMSKAFAAANGMEHIWAIITNAYGERELSARFINTTIQKMLTNQPLKFTSAVQNYDFIYVTDVANAFYLLGKYGRPFYQYVIGSGQPQPLRNYILQMSKLLAPDLPLSFGSAPFSGIALPLSSFNSKDLLEDTGFRPEVSFKDGILKTAFWLKQS